MNIKIAPSSITLALFICSSCLVPFRSFERTAKPSAPDYAKSKYWAALPDKKDSADLELIRFGINDGQKTAKADVFYIPPTSYVNGTGWNASVDDSSTRSLTEKIGCKLVASAFNGSCKVYAPHYRSAILYSYFAFQKNNARLSFKLAYEDVQTAFLYYLKHFNKGRPIVIASHSQGTDYAVLLIKQFFDKDTALRNKLVAAYIVGRPVYDTTFKLIKPMTSPTETGGYVTWNSVSYRTNTFYGDRVGKIVGINPLSWKRDTAYVPHEFNKGGLPFTADKIDTAIADAKVAPSGFLWVHRPIKLLSQYPGINTPYFHKDDYAFFFMNVRENVKLRVEEYLRTKDKKPI